MPVLAGGVPEKLQDCFDLLVDSISALQRENKEMLWGSMVKETMKRKKPSFNETYYGFRTFSHLLEDAQRRGIVTLRRDQRSGSYIIEDLGRGGGGRRRTAASAAEPAAERKAEAGGRGRGARTAARSAAAARARRPRPAHRRPGRAGARRPRAARAGPTTADEDDEDEGEDDAAGDEARAAARACRARAPAPVAAAPPERPSFSLFSWLKRDGEDKKAT